MDISKHANTYFQSFSERFGEWLSGISHNIFGSQPVAMQPVPIVTRNQKSTATNSIYINDELHVKSRVADLDYY